VELVGIEDRKNALFYVAPSIHVSLRLYQITFANDTYSKIGKDKQNSRTTNVFTHIF